MNYKALSKIFIETNQIIIQFMTFRFKYTLASNLYEFIYLDYKSGFDKIW